MSRRSVLVCLAVILALASVQASATTLGITADGRFFTIDGVPTYLNGISYYSGTCISTPSYVTQDFDDMVARKINWVRVWCFWGGCSGSGAVTDLSGNVREPYMSRLKTLITEANSRGMIVDVTMDRDRNASPDINDYIACARTLATQLLPYRNVYIDVGNERDVGDSRYVSIPDCGALITAIKAIDPNRICTASGTPSNQSDLDYFLTTGHLDFIATHLCRDSGCASQTAGTVRTYVAWMTNLGKRVPVHLQEPFRRDYAGYNPVQEDFYRDDSGAKAAEAAGWCLHNGSGPVLERSFCMNNSNGRLFAQLDSVEQDAASNIDDAIGAASWKVRRYQAEYVEQISHSVGRKEGLFWSANTTNDAAGYMTYGPYLNGIAAGNYRAAWRLMIGDNSGSNDTVATVDVSSGGTVIAQRTIRRMEFTEANAWQTFNVDYVGLGQQNLEFRTYWPDNCYLKVDHITLSQDPPPDIIIGLTAAPGEGQVTLNWTNPTSLNFTGTMVRFKTSGYPTSETDGTLLCDRSGAPSSSDSFIHTGLTGRMYFYAAFAHDAAGRYAPAVSASASPHVPLGWVSEDFNSYSNGDLGVQGDWATIGGAHAQVQSTLAKGGSGKAIVMECSASVPSIGDQIAFTEKSSGYFYLTVDVAQNSAGTINSDFASVSVFGSNSTSEIVKIHLRRGQVAAEYGPGSLAVLSAATNNTWYAVKIGINVDARKLDFWLDGASRGNNLAWKGSATNISKIVIASDRNTALTTQQAFFDNIMLDVRPGAVASVTDDGVWTPSQSRLHFSFGAVPGAGEYHYAIGTSSGGTQTRDWTSCGTSTDYTASGLSLAESTSYYVSVQAGTGHGVWGAGANSSGIKVAPGLAKISDAKALADGASASTKALRGKLVSAPFTGYFYIQEPGSPSSLKVVSTASVAAGDQVDVAGFMQGSALERFIDCTGNGVIKTTGPGGPYPVALAALSVGGVDLNTNTHGVAGGLGPNNIGLHVRACGKVTQVQTTTPKYFYIDDGSGLKDGTTTPATGGVENVGVRVADPASFPPEGSYVAVKGVISCFSSSGRRPQILPREIQTLHSP